MGTRISPSSKEVGVARRDLVDALEQYVRLARQWNAPDDEYTKASVRRLAEDAIKDEFDA